MLEKKKFKIAIQINGKTKEIIELDSSHDEKDVKNIALNSNKIKKMINNKSVKKIIFVPEKIMNILI